MTDCSVTTWSRDFEDSIIWYRYKYYNTSYGMGDWRWVVFNWFQPAWASFQTPSQWSGHEPGTKKKPSRFSIDKAGRVAQRCQSRKQVHLVVSWYSGSLVVELNLACNLWLCVFVHLTEHVQQFSWAAHQVVGQFPHGVADSEVLRVHATGCL